jgi:hypothetical protein
MIEPDRAERQRHPAFAEAIRRISQSPPVVAMGFLLAGVVFGLLTALTGGINVLAGWLIATYVLIAVALQHDTHTQWLAGNNPSVVSAEPIRRDLYSSGAGGRE